MTKKQAQSKRTYENLMADPVKREARRVRLANYMRAYYKRSATYRAQGRVNKNNWRAANQSWVNFKNSLDRHSITLDEYHAAFERQNEACAICAIEDQQLVIDHCHGTGRFRALLCWSCNTGIGQFKERPDLFDAAKAYVNRWSQRAA